MLRIFHEKMQNLKARLKVEISDRAIILANLLIQMRHSWGVNHKLLLPYCHLSQATNCTITICKAIISD